MKMKNIFLHALPTQTQMKTMLTLFPQTYILLQPKQKKQRPSEWKIYKIKRSRTQGKEYVSNNKVHKKKSLQPYQPTCRYKCNINVTSPSDWTKVIRSASKPPK